MERTKAIVTMAIGEKYVEEFETLVRRNWERYAERHGYDLYVLTEPIDAAGVNDRKSVHWQKLLIAMLAPLQRYDHVVWIDGDVLINPYTAPCIVAQTTTDKIAVAEFISPVNAGETIGARFELFSRKFHHEVTGMVLLTEPEADIDDRSIDSVLSAGARRRALINTGVFVCQPKRHAEFLSRIYLAHDADAPDGSLEQTPFGQALFESDMVEFIDARFNMPWSLYAARYYPFLFDMDWLERNVDVATKCVNTFYHNNYFCHFPGHAKHAVTKQPIRWVDQDARHILEALSPKYWALRHQIFPGLDLDRDLDRDVKGD